MASPTFDGNVIFDSWDSDGNNFSEGCLTVGDYQWIKQTLHFNGEIGNRMLFHGTGDRTWVYEGLLSAANSDTFIGALQQIETYIDKTGMNKNPNQNQGTYFALVDSFGNSFPYAQIHHFHYLEYPQAQVGGGFVCRVRIEGIVLGMQQEG